MWFKNLQLFRLTEPFTLDASALAEALTPFTFKPCGRLEPASFGWVPPLGRHDPSERPLAHGGAAGYILLCARKEEKVLPAAVINEIVAERIQALEDEQMRPVRRKERVQIKEEVMQDLLPKAFTKSGLTYAYIAPRDGWLVVDASSAKRAEELIALLRRSLERFPVQPPMVKMNPATVMTAWLTGDMSPAPFMPQDQCELRDPGEEGSVVRCRRQDLGAEEILKHIEVGKQVVRLAVGWNDRLSCVIGEDLAVKRLRFEDVVAEELDHLDAEDEAAAVDAQFALMTLELAKFYPSLLEAFGGEEEKRG